MAGPESVTRRADADPLGRLEHPPILVVGNDHVGARWVSDVLSAHPQVAVLSDLGLFGSVGLEPPFRGPHWNAANSERMFGRRMGLGQFLTRERVVADLRSLADRWLAHALRPEHRFLVECSPMGPAGVRAFAQLYPEGLVIWMVRDGRAVAQSFVVEQQQRWQPTDEAPTPPAPWREMWSLGTAWATHVKLFQELARELPVSFQQLRYEDMHARPQQSALKIFELCQIPCDEELLDQIVTRVGPPAGLPSRAWTRREHAMYRAGAGAALHQLGYSRPPAPALRLLRRALLAYERATQLI